MARVKNQQREGDAGGGEKRERPHEYCPPGGGRSRELVSRETLRRGRARVKEGLLPLARVDSNPTIHDPKGALPRVAKTYQEPESCPENNLSASAQVV